MQTNTEKALLLEQYRIYIESKEKFIDRSFQTNRFFIVFVTFMFIVLCVVREYLLYNMTSTFVFSAIGLGASFLWWSNAEVYDYIMKVKFTKVIDTLEKELPVQVHSIEKIGFEEVKKSKKKFYFSNISYSDIQRLMAFGTFVLFLALVILEWASL